MSSNTNHSLNTRHTFHSVEYLITIFLPCLLYFPSPITCISSGPYDIIMMSLIDHMIWDIPILIPRVLSISYSTGSSHSNLCGSIWCPVWCMYLVTMPYGRLQWHTVGCTLHRYSIGIGNSGRWTNTCYTYILRGILTHLLLTGVKRSRFLSFDLQRM